MADPTEAPSAAKWFGSFFQIVPWLKDLRTVAAICIIAFVGFTIYRAYFLKTQQQTQHNTTTVTGQSGSHITVEAPSQKMESNHRWSVGPYVGINTEGDLNGGIIVLYSF